MDKIIEAIFAAQGNIGGHYQAVSKCSRCGCEVHAVGITCDPCMSALLAKAHEDALLGGAIIAECTRLKEKCGYVRGGPDRCITESGMFHMNCPQRNLCDMIERWEEKK